jgi:hypothetical protein
MRLVLSSFMVGAGVTAYGTTLLTAGLRERKQFLDPKFDDEEFSAFLYQSVSTDE